MLSVLIADDHPIVPHGMSVILNAPAVFRFTAQANPQPHLYAAELMGCDTSGVGEQDAGEVLQIQVPRRPGEKFRVRFRVLEIFRPLMRHSMGVSQRALRRERERPAGALPLPWTRFAGAY